jgi:PD-(D/E)XK endonuclease
MRSARSPTGLVFERAFWLEGDRGSANCERVSGSRPIRGCCEHTFVNTREQGDIGELSAMEWLVSKGASVAIPVGHSPHWDVIAELDGRLLRVQVKTSTCFVKGRWDVTLCTRGGNQSWNGLSKHLDRSRFDNLFVLVGDGRRWFIPAESLNALAGLRLGGPKYAEFEVERGRPIRDRQAQEPPLESALQTTRGDVRVVKGGGL